jgi:zona occludens toxin
MVSMMEDWAAKGRAIYVDGVPDLKIKHEAVDARKWHTDVPDGSLIVIDEVQRLWRPQGPSQKLPEDIAALETHRHRGIDFIIVTQGRRLVHTNVRALVGRHVHLRDLGILGRRWHEWQECGDETAYKSAPFSKKYILPKRVFSQYKSASEHIKPVRSFPRVLVVLAAAVIGVGVLAWKVTATIKAKTQGEGVHVPGAADRLPAAAPGVLTSAAGGSAITGESIARSFVPRLKARPETAPAYDHLRIVATMPKVIGGWCQGSACRCYTQQGSDPNIPHEDCKAIIAAYPFDPYRGVAPGAVVPAVAAASAPVAFEKPAT